MRTSRDDDEPTTTADTQRRSRSHVAKRSTSRGRIDGRAIRPSSLVATWRDHIERSTRIDFTLARIRVVIDGKRHQIGPVYPDEATALRMLRAWNAERGEGRMWRCGELAGDGGGGGGGGGEKPPPQEKKKIKKKKPQK